MEARITPELLGGILQAPPSKSIAHRLLICAALADGPSHLATNGTNDDMDATVDCLNALGACIQRTAEGFQVTPIERQALKNPGLDPVVLDCRDSASTLRFLLPLAATFRRPVTFTGSQQLSTRPLDALLEELMIAGTSFTYTGSLPLTIQGPMRPGHFILPGNITSQYATGLLLTAPVLDGTSTIEVIHPIESAPYLKLTLDAMRAFGIQVDVSSGKRQGHATTIYKVSRSQHYRTVERPLACEGDWSATAFWMAAAALSPKGIKIENLDTRSAQGDRAMMGAVAIFGGRVQRSSQSIICFRDRLRSGTVNLADTPDLLPPLAILAAFAEGTSRFTHCQRLELKESNRIAAVMDNLQRLGVACSYQDGILSIEGKPQIQGGVQLDAFGDHRIAMMCAILASYCQNPCTISGWESVNKSYPRFFSDFQSLGGQVEFLS